MLARCTPASARSRRKSNLRTRLCQLEDHGKDQSRNDYDFRFHGTAMLPYGQLVSSPRATLIFLQALRESSFARRLRVRESTSVYYKSLKDFPAKPPDARFRFSIRPTRSFKVIGRLAFESDGGWNFLRSMIYNAQIHGADAVWLKSSSTRREVTFQHGPPRMDFYRSALQHGKRHALVQIYET